MRVVYKYELPSQEFVQLAFPAGSKILSAINQRERIVIYTLVDPNEIKQETYNFRTMGTGHEVNNSMIKDYIFLNSVSLHDGLYVFHIFYKEGHI